MTTLAGQPLRTLLLDLDDTILDSRTSLLEAWDLVSQAIHRRVPRLEVPAIRDQIGRSTRWYWSDPERVREGRIDLPGARRAILDRTLCELGHEDAELATETERIYTRHREERLAPLPGAFEALGALRARVARLGLVTNGAASVQRAKIERFRLERFFDTIVIEGELGAGKPDPVVFDHALSRLGSQPDEAVMVGDSYDADIRGALGVGLRAVWIEPTGERPPPSDPAPHLVLRSLSELVDHLGP